ncbi:MAG TPA: kelch repeat-containing protein [Acidimicrobiales bacterium]|nr:kelch repeat-containing protein [Acidimicrobiales bacterium]
MKPPVHAGPEPDCGGQAHYRTRCSLAQVSIAFRLRARANLVGSAGTLIVAAAFLFGSITTAHGQASSQAGGWTPGGAPTGCAPSCPGGAYHSATLLKSGKVLVVGGATNDAKPTNAAQLYDPAKNAWSPTGSMKAARSQHTATLLDNGEVLVVGGADVDGNPVDAAEVYDPNKGVWTAAGSMSNSRRGMFTATLVSGPNCGENCGKVLVAGGFTKNPAAELYDPRTGSWTRTGELIQPRYQHVAVMLKSGRVLVAGGRDATQDITLSSAELFDPVTGTWAPTSSLVSPYRPGLPAAALLPDGQVLVAGGFSIGQTKPSGSTRGSILGSGPGADEGQPVPTPAQPSEPVGPTGLSQLYDPGRGNWRPTGSLAAVRQAPLAVRLPGGKVLVAAGTSAEDAPQNAASAEVYDPKIGGWTTIARMPHGRGEGVTGILLPEAPVTLCGENCGKVLIVGPVIGEAIPIADLYTPTERGNAEQPPMDAQLGSAETKRSNSPSSLVPLTVALVLAAALLVVVAMARKRRAGSHQ